MRLLSQKSYVVGVARRPDAAQLVSRLRQAFRYAQRQSALMQHLWSELGAAEPTAVSGTIRLEWQARAVEMIFRDLTRADAQAQSDGCQRA